MSKKHPKIFGGKKPLTFAAIFAVVAAVEYLIFYEFAPAFGVDGFIEATAAILYGILKITGASVVLTGETLVFPAMHLQIIYECTGGFAMFIFSACVIAYPSSIRSKLLGHLFGIGGVFVISMARLLVLSWAALHARGLFDFIHKYLWQATFILLVLALWVLWVNIFTGEHKTAHVEKK